MKVSLKGFGEATATFMTTDTSLKAGDPVKLCGSMQVQSAGSTDLFVGICTAVRGSFASVQLSGYAELKYTGTAPALGRAKLYANGSGGVTANSAGSEYIVCSVDSSSAVCGVIL